MTVKKIDKEHTTTEWLSGKLEGKNNWVLDHIGKSLKRDRSYPIGYLFKKGWQFFYRMFTSPIHLRKCDKVGKNPRTEKKPYIINNGKIVIGDHFNICSRSVQAELVTTPDGELLIGDDVFINFGTTVCAANKVSIGDNVKIGPYCMIHDTDFHVQGDDFAEVDGLPVVIEDDVWLGSRVIVMKGSVIGSGSVIAAGSVVSGIIPPNVIAGGMPARVIKKRTHNSDQDQEDRGIRLEEDLQIRAGEIIEQILGVKADQIIGKTASEVPSWTAQAHTDLIVKLSEAFGIKADSRSAGRYNSITKIFNWISSQMLDSETIDTGLLK